MVQTWRSWSAGAALAFLQPQYQDICLSRDSIAGIIKKSILVDLTSRSHMILTESTARDCRDISTLSTEFDVTNTIISTSYTLPPPVYFNLLTPGVGQLKLNDWESQADSPTRLTFQIY